MYVRAAVCCAVSAAQVASTQATGAPVDSSYGHADAGTRYDGGGGAAAGAGGGAGAGAVGGGGGSYEDYYDASASGGQAAAETGLAWSRPVMTGVAPKARGGHAAGLVGNLLIVFGGHYYGGGGKVCRRQGTNWPMLTGLSCCGCLCCRQV